MPFCKTYFMYYILKQKKGSLCWVLDKTKTAMGGRLLRKYLEQPLIEEELILKRLDFLEELCNETNSL